MPASIVKLKTGNLEKGEGLFFIDTRADVNLVKVDKLRLDVEIDNSEVLFIRGVVPRTAKTLGFVNISIERVLERFHVVESHLDLKEDAMISHAFFKRRSVVLDYKNDNLSIGEVRHPFLTTETISLPPKTIKKMYVRVTNLETHTGHVLRQDIKPGVYFGDAVIMAERGIAYVFVYNMLGSEQEFKIPLLDLGDVEK